MAKKQSEFVKWMGPTLDALRDLDGSGKPREVADWIVEHLGISDEKLDEMLKSGQTRFYNQVHWARQYLVWEGLLDSSTRGVWSLTPKGYKTSLDYEEAHAIFLKWVKIHAKSRKQNEESETPPASDLGTEDFETENDVLQAEAEDDDHGVALLKILQSVTPDGFERICARLLRESGFEKVTVTGRPKDGGIDGIGILQINPFVSFKVLFQCKRYKGSVSRSQVGDFRNAMIGRADKGIIITTGTFSMDARREADRDGAPPVELVDGQKLVEMFAEAGLGVKPKIVLEVDHSFFAEYLPNEAGATPSAGRMS